jgi:hypothetical protein
VTHAQQTRVFGKQKQEHILILASGDRVRHLTIRPWMAALAFCFVGVFAIGYLLATSYLVLRDDLIGATMARRRACSTIMKTALQPFAPRSIASPRDSCSISRSSKTRSTS